MLLTSVALSIQAQPLMDYLTATAASLQAPGQYVETVMNTTRSLKEAH